MKKIFLCIFALVLSLCCFSGCKSSGEIYTIEEAFDAGLITREDIMEICYRRFGEVYTCDSPGGEWVKVDYTPPKEQPELDKRTEKRIYVTAQEGWIGAATLPRELSLKNGRLYQNPVREIERYRKHPVHAENIRVLGERVVENVQGVKCEIAFTLDMGTADRAGVKLFCGHNLEVVLFYDRVSELVYFDRSNMGTLVSGSSRERDALIRSCAVRVKDGRIRFRLFLDVSSLEIFLNDGERAMTGLVYAPRGADGVVFFSEGGAATILDLEKYDIVVP